MRKTITSGKAPPSQRQLRVAEQIRHLLVEILQRGHFRDPALQDAHRVTVTAVEIGPDLKHATAYIMPLGGDKLDTYIEALNRASGYFRTELGGRMDLRYIPRISFKPDESFDEAQKIETLLRNERVQRDVLKKDEE